MPTSLAVQSNFEVAVDDGFGGVCVNVGAVGATRSTAYVGAVTGTPARAFPARSLIESALVSFSCNDPVPDPVDAVTVHDDPLPDTPVITGDPDNPALTNLKFPAATPVTDVLNDTAHETDTAFVGDPPARLIPVTVGEPDGFAAATPTAALGEPDVVPDAPPGEPDGFPTTALGGADGFAAATPTAPFDGPDVVPDAALGEPDEFPNLTLTTALRGPDGLPGTTPTTGLGGPDGFAAAAPTAPLDEPDCFPNATPTASIPANTSRSTPSSTSTRLGLELHAAFLNSLTITRLCLRLCQWS